MTSWYPISWQSVPVSRVADVNPQTPLPFASSDDTEVPLYRMAAIDEDTGSLRQPDLVPFSRGRLRE